MCWISDLLMLNVTDKHWIVSATAVCGAEEEGTLIPRLKVHVQKSSLCKAVTLISWALGTRFYLSGCCGHPTGTCCYSPPTEVLFRELKLTQVFLHEHSLVRVGGLWYSLQKLLSIQCWPRQSTNECLLEGWGLVKLEMTQPKRAYGGSSGFSPKPHPELPILQKGCWYFSMWQKVREVSFHLSLQVPVWLRVLEKN